MSQTEVSEGTRGRWIEAHERLPTASAFYVVQTTRKRVKAVSVVRWVEGLPPDLQAATAWRHVARWFSVPIPHPRDH